ncbi:hypothetical protein SDC9_122967 [bioreactor metagenome]|uniref:Uncharacterized protein n=1 Tax=bioreactor metagenome TaxID=1076179 RepID=A0A645CGJ2_9ZZZZ
MRAQKLAKRAEAAGGYISPYEKRKLSPDDTATKACELGERLFELAQEARAYGVDAEEALEVYNKTFVHKIKNTL